MFIETLEFTIPVDLCSLCTTLQKSTQSGLEFPASVNSYGTTQDASIQVALKANKLTFKVDGVSSNASIISKSECRTLKLSVFDVDRTLIPQENDTFSSNNVSNYHTSTSVPNSHKRTYEQSPAPVRAKIRRNSGGENKKNKSPNVDRVRDSYSNNKSKSMDNSLSNNVLVKTEPEDPDLIEIDPDPEPLKTEQPEQSSSCMYEQTSHSSYEQNVPHVQDYSEPGTSQQHRSPGQNVDDFLVFQDDSYENDDNEEYSNDDGYTEALQRGNTVLLPESNWTKTNFDFYSHIKPVGDMFRQDMAMCLTPDQTVMHKALGDSVTGNENRFPCGYCQKIFATQNARKYHCESVHEKKTFSCVCGKVYKYHPGLFRHIKDCPIYLMSNKNQTSSFTDKPGLS